jgi:hypothetical protein
MCIERENLPSHLSHRHKGSQLVLLHVTDSYSSYHTLITVSETFPRSKKCAKTPLLECFSLLVSFSSPIFLMPHEGNTWLRFAEGFGKMRHFH